MVHIPYCRRRCGWVGESNFASAFRALLSDRAASTSLSSSDPWTRLYLHLIHVSGSSKYEGDTKSFPPQGEAPSAYSAASSLESPLSACRCPLIFPAPSPAPLSALCTQHLMASACNPHCPSMSQLPTDVATGNRHQSGWLGKTNMYVNGVIHKSSCQAVPFHFCHEFLRRPPSSLPKPTNSAVTLAPQLIPTHQHAYLGNELELDMGRWCQLLVVFFAITLISAESEQGKFFAVTLIS